MSKLLRRVSYAILGLCLAMKSDVSGMAHIDTSKTHVKTTDAAMAVTAKGSVVVSIDLGAIGVNDAWNFDFADGDGKFTADDVRAKEITPTKTATVKLKLENEEVKNKDGKIVAHSGLMVDRTEMNADGNNEKPVKFTQGTAVKLQWILYKNGAKSGDKFAANNPLPEEWATEASGDLTCNMTLSIVANK